MHARQRKRSEIANLERELEDLKDSLWQNRTMQMCFSCTGLAELLKTNPTLIQDLTTTHQNLKIVLQVIAQAVQTGASRSHELPGLNSECVVRPIQHVACHRHTVSKLNYSWLRAPLRYTLGTLVENVCSSKYLNIQSMFWTNR
jgi:hypothetical protein